MTVDLWGKKIPRPRRKKDVNLPASTTPYSITNNDCIIFGHTLWEWDLAGCTTCIDCHVNLYCRGCIASHPLDENAIPILCPRHEESQVST